MFAANLMLQQQKRCNEEAEPNAIRTEWLRTGPLLAADAAKIRSPTALEPYGHQLSSQFCLVEGTSVIATPTKH